METHGHAAYAERKIYHKLTTDLVASAISLVVFLGLLAPFL